MVLKGRVPKETKKIWIYPYLGGSVGRDGDNIHKKQKNMPLKSILEHSTGRVKKKLWNFPYFSGVDGFENVIFHKKNNMLSKCFLKAKN